MSLILGNESNIFAKGVIGNVRQAQEDCHGYKLGTPNGDLFVVCDGMGGHVGGATASRIAVDCIIEHIDREKYAAPVEALDGALQFANMQILGHAAAHPELKGMGTTACIVLMQDDGVWIAHVGDSRIYLYLGKENQLHRITKDHSYVQALVDAGQITDDEAEHHPNKNRIMKALGIKPELHPTFNYESRPIYPKNGDVFLICSDGLCGMIPDKTIERVMGEGLTLQERGDKLIELAMAGETVVPGGQDNCTVELIKIDNSNWNTSEFKSYSPTRLAQMKIIENHPQGNTSKKESNSGKKVVIAVLFVAVALLATGGISWWLTKGQPKCECDNTLKEIDEFKTQHIDQVYKSFNTKVQTPGARAILENNLNNNALQYNKMVKAYNKKCDTNKDTIKITINQRTTTIK